MAHLARPTWDEALELCSNEAAFYGEDQKPSEFTSFDHSKSFKIGLLKSFIHIKMA
jgi:hypothetical protein